MVDSRDDPGIGRGQSCEASVGERPRRELQKHADFHDDWRRPSIADSSPALDTLGGKRQILSVNAASVTAHDPVDGRILWEYAWATDKWPKCAQPVVLEGDRVFLSAGYGVGCVLLQVKSGTNGKFSVTEVWKNRNMKTQFSNLVVRNAQNQTSAR
jgi:hypothetical protein